MAGLAPLSDDRNAPVARSGAMLLALHLCQLYAPARTPVIFVGETGTGKSHFARYLHALGPRRRYPFVEVTAAELEGDVGKDHLFGHDRGAYTGAYTRRIGLFQDAGSGTLLLDDFHLLPRSEQARLLRPLDQGLHRTTGVSRDIPIACRMVFGIQGGLDRLVQDGTLLPDLRYRLGHSVIELPPLRERPEDIAVLAMEFLRQCPKETGVPGPTRFALGTIAALAKRQWLGNARDLRAAIQRAYLHAQHEDEVRPEHLPGGDSVLVFVAGGDREANDHAIRWALWRSRGCKSAAARLLGVNRKTVLTYLARQRLSSPPARTGQTA